MTRPIASVIAIAISFGVTLALQAEDVRVKGDVHFKDEDGSPNTPQALPEKIVLYVNAQLVGETSPCPTEAPVSSQNFGYTYNVPEECLGSKNKLIMGVNSPPEYNRVWHVLKPRDPVFLDGGDHNYTRDINVLYKRDPDLAERRRWMSVARTALEEADYEVARFAYAAAARGADYEFTALAANDLIDAGRESDILALFEGKDLEDLPIDENTRFRFTMRKANAARAAGLQGGAAANKFFAMAIEVYEEALEIYPANPDARSLAYATLNNARTSVGAGDLVSFLEAEDSLAQAFEDVYNAFEVDGKVELDRTDGLSQEIESWSQNLIKIR